MLHWQKRSARVWNCSHLPIRRENSASAVVWWNRVAFGPDWRAGRPMRPRPPRGALPLIDGSWSSSTMVEPEAFDILIRDGTIIDGTGASRFAADIGVKDDRIAAIGPLPSARAKRVVQAM